MRVMEVNRCAVCERTLLLGERSYRFAPDGVGEFVEVCQLCREPRACVALREVRTLLGAPLAGDAQQ